ncbi:MAG TPA: aminotransferase class V-fold PLP-dependent enzyme [Terriglobales bacterium]|jgi:aromatic-L-amino-acid decarboxylase|nr:aminotransferase class V-fold PLP-dependent enzyme [Terriglobales bacterium]
MDPLDLSAEEFRRLAASITDLSSNFLTTLDSRPIFPKTSGDEVERLFSVDLPRKGLGPEALSALQDVIAHSRAQNGRFFGYVQGPGEPVAALGDLMASILNQNMTAWRSSPSGVTIEKTVVRWLAEAVGCAGFVGTLTGGGSAANLMGLTMAREAKIPANERGLRGAPPSAIYASTEVHMAVPKAVAMIGLGRENLRSIPCDKSYRMIPSQLEQALRHDKAAGITPVAVVASAGTVNTGAIDPLREISEIAHAYGAWMHVDGAYGALAAIAAPEKFSGLAMADSLSLDPHKWLYQPLDCGCLLYRDLTMARTTFTYTGDYARQLTVDPVEGFAFFEESIELSRRCRALKLWLSFRYHGMDAFRDAIQQDLDHAQRLAALVRECPELELVAEGELSAVCFRHLVRPDASEEERNRFNTDLMKRIVRRGKVYPSNATLEGKFCLRACIVNHLTKDSDIDAVVPEVLAAAREIEA